MHINDKLALFYTAHNVLPTPLFSILFPSSIFSFSLLYNFIIFLPQCFLFPSTTILIFPSISLFSLLNVIIPSSTILLFSLLFLPLFLLTSIVFPPPPPHFDCFDRVDVGSIWGRCGVDVGSMWGRCRVDVGSLLFSLLIFIVFPPPPPHFCFPSSSSF